MGTSYTEMTERGDAAKNKRCRVRSFEESNASNANVGYMYLEYGEKREEGRGMRRKETVEARAFMIRQLQSPKLHDETRLTFMTALCSGAICASVVYGRGNAGIS